jgi:hypothetical protein
MTRFVLIRVDCVMLLWPSLLCPPSSIRSCALVKRVSKPSRLLRVAEVRLLHHVGHNDDQTEVLARYGIMEVAHFLSQPKVLLVVGLLGGLTWRWVLEGSFRFCQHQYRERECVHAIYL